MFFRMHVLLQPLPPWFEDANHLPHGVALPSFAAQARVMQRPRREVDEAADARVYDPISGRRHDMNLKALGQGRTFRREIRTTHISYDKTHAELMVLTPMTQQIWKDSGNLFHLFASSFFPIRLLRTISRLSPPSDVTHFVS